MSDENQNKIDNYKSAEFIMVVATESENDTDAILAGLKKQNYVVCHLCVVRVCG